MLAIQQVVGCSLTLKETIAPLLKLFKEK